MRSLARCWLTAAGCLPTCAASSLTDSSRPMRAHRIRMRVPSASIRHSSTACLVVCAHTQTVLHASSGTDGRSRATTPCVNPSRRAALTGASAVAFLLIGSGPAAAHVEVSAEGSARAGTGPVTLRFHAESESISAGITGVRTRLPDGIAPEDVAVADGPEGWELTPTADGLELGGPEIPAGEDAQYSLTVELLPADTTELAFPTIQVYSDGTEDAWIEPITDDVPEP